MAIYSATLVQADQYVAHSSDLTISNQLQESLTHLDNICSLFFFYLKDKTM